MKKLKDVFTIFFVLFLTIFSFSCTHVRKTDSQEHLSGLKIINHGGYILPTPFDTVKYYIDRKKVASHNSAANFEKMIQLPPGDHYLIVDYGHSYKCIYSFTIDQGQIGTFNNYNYYTYVMNKVDKATNANTVDLEPWGFKNVNPRVLERKVEETHCSELDNNIGRKICHEYHDNLCHEKFIK